jgi:predicted O-methyltransferase YrrM
VEARAGGEAVSVLGAAQRSMQPVLAPLAVRSLRRSAGEARTIDDALDLVFEYDVAGIRIAPMQSRHEIRALLELVAAKRPRVVLEIGTARGGTLFLWSRVAAPAALLVSVDLPDGEFGGGYPHWRIPLYRAFARAGQRVELLRADSHAEATRDLVRELAGEVDFLFIDGDHTYEGVARDFELYAPLVRPGGLVALHDIVPPRPSDGNGLPQEASDEFLVGEVPQFWAELRARHDVVELVDDWQQGRFGIGVVQL